MRIPNYGVWAAFVLIVVLAAATRLAGLSWAPPQFNQDEASNAYDAYCLLQTGMDRWQTPFPLMLYAFGEGDNRPPLYAYCITPFLYFLGMENLAVATRLPAALGGIFTVACFGLLVYRTCGAFPAIWAALFLAVSPWHIQVTRLGHESSLTPIFWPVALLCLSLAGWDFGNAGLHPARRRHAAWMAAFGAVVALSIYSYASHRAFMPVMLVSGLMIYWPRLRSDWREPGTRRGWMAAAGAFLVVASPYVYVATSHWRQLSYRSLQVSLFHQPDLSLQESTWLLLTQYAAHYGPEWLFKVGDQSLIHSTPGVGVVHWVLLPLLVCGLIECVMRLRQHRLYALVLAWLIVYPVASAPAVAGPHALRAAVGIGVFEWLAAIGIVALTRWVYQQRLLRVAVVAATFVGLAASTRQSLDGYFRIFAKNSYIQALYQNDLVRAVEYLRTRHQRYDRLFISDARSQQDGWVSFQPYIYLLCYLPIEPRDFWAAEIDRYYPEPNLGFEIVERVGRFYFTLRQEVWREQFEHRPHEKVLILARPGDIRGATPIDVLRDASGKPSFEVIEIGPLVAPNEESAQPAEELGAVQSGL